MTLDIHIQGATLPPRDSLVRGESLLSHLTFRLDPSRVSNGLAN